MLVEHVSLVAGQRGADGHRQARAHLAQGGDDGRLCGTVGIEHAATIGEARDELGRQRFAAEDEQPHGRQRISDHRQETGNGREIADPIQRNEAHHVLRRARHIVGWHHQRAAERKRRPHLLDGGVECDRKTLIDALGVGDAVGGRQCGDETCGVAMLDDHALRSPGRTRCIDHVADVGWPHAGLVRRDRLVGHGGNLIEVAVNQQCADAGAFQGSRQRGLAHHQRDRAILEDASHALGRKFGIDRHITGAGLQHAEQGRKQLD